MFLTTLYQQDVESGQETVILLVVAGVITGIGTVGLRTLDKSKGDRKAERFLELRAKGLA
jgi:hypothetical protein